VPHVQRWVVDTLSSGQRIHGIQCAVARCGEGEPLRRWDVDARHSCSRNAPREYHRQSAQAEDELLCAIALPMPMSKAIYSDLNARGNMRSTRSWAHSLEVPSGLTAAALRAAPRPAAQLSALGLPPSSGQASAWASEGVWREWVPGSAPVPAPQTALLSGRVKDWAPASVPAAD